VTRKRIAKSLRIAKISAMSSKLAHDCACETWPKEKFVSIKKVSKNLYVVVMSM
jgi:hypothetical protein